MSLVTFERAVDTTGVLFLLLVGLVTAGALAVVGI
jgi:hypothetical protein